MRTLIHKTLRALGMDVVPYPVPFSILYRQRILQLLSDLNIDCVIDVGANEGQFAGNLRQFGYQGRIVSIEPVSETFRRLRESRQGDNNWTGINCALGATRTKAEIHVTTGDDFSSLLTPNEFARKRFEKSTAVERTEAVDVYPLEEVFDSLVGADVRRAFLKIDTQGYDLEVIKGASKILDRVVLLQTELSLRPIYDGMPDYLTALKFLSGTCFEPTAMFPVSYDSDNCAIEFDCVLCHTSAVGARSLDSPVALRA